jgi:hypothetical protein
MIKGLRYERCFYCGKKPKSSMTEPGVWDLNHWCIVQLGNCFIRSDTRTGVINAWNGQVNKTYQHARKATRKELAKLMHKIRERG